MKIGLKTRKGKYFCHESELLKCIIFERRMLFAFLFLTLLLFQNVYRGENFLFFFLGKFNYKLKCVWFLKAILLERYMREVLNLSMVPLGFIV